MLPNCLRPSVACLPQVGHQTSTVVRLALLLSALLAAPLAAQTTHTVTLQNLTFDPASLTIEVGDTVVWENAVGTHNVNGTSGDAYPDNPEGFGRAVASGPWTYSFTFNIVGDYGYRCDPHFSMGMVGSITVSTPTFVEDDLPAGMALSGPSPNPFSDEAAFTLTTATPEPVRVAIYDVQGREIAVLHDGPIPAGQPVVFVWAPRAAPTGVYFVLIQGTTFRAVRKVVHTH